jgi:hypothetical protein
MAVNVDSVRANLDRLHKSRRDIDRLIENQRLLILKSLPQLYGFSSMDELIAALGPFASRGLRSRIDGSAPVKKRARKKATRGMRYTPEVRIAVRKELEAGGRPCDIRRRYGMSLATIAKWKSLFGIVDKAQRKVATKTANSMVGESVPANAAG